jgi:hypothetical protein
MITAAEVGNHFLPISDVEPGTDWPVLIYGSARHFNATHCDGIPLLEPIPGSPIKLVRVLNGHPNDLNAVAVTGLLLCPTPAMYELMTIVDGEYHTDFVLNESASLDDVLAYRAQLRSLGLDCNHTYSHLQTGLYPVDFSAHAAGIVTTDKVPDMPELFFNYDFMPDTVWDFYIVGKSDIG